jgi:cytochrome P450
MARTPAAAASADVHAVATAVLAALAALTVLNALVRRALGALASIARWHRQAFVLRGAPMAPGYLPFIGHTVALFKAVGNYPCTWDLFARWATATAPKPVRVQIFTRHCVVIADPSTMKRVMSSNMKNYPKDTEFSYAPFLEILGTGLVTSGGETWRRMRGHISKALRVEILDEIIAIANRAVERLCVKLDDAKRDGTSVDMEHEFRLLTLQVIGEAILSLQPEQSDELFPSLYLPIMDECNARSLSPWRAWIPTPEWFAHKSRVRKLDAAIIGIVRARWRARRARAAGSPAPDDILERVLEQVDVREYGAETETQLCYEIKTFLLAGHETSAAMLTWTLHELSVGEAKMMGKVRAEAKAVFGKLKPGVLPTRDALASLEYTLAALKETLRLYSVVPVVNRVAEEDDDLGGVRVPAGTTVIMSLQGVHHRADVWPDPLTYKPDRFLEKDFDENEGFKFLPFIQGPRNCLGQYLAMLEARVVLGTLVGKYEFLPVNAGENGKKHTKAIPIAPAKGSHFFVK